MGGPRRGGGARSGREAGRTGRDLSSEAVPEEGPAWPVEGGSLPFSVSPRSGAAGKSQTGHEGFRPEPLPAPPCLLSQIQAPPPLPTFVAPPFSGSIGAERGFTPVSPLFLSSLWCGQGRGTGLCKRSSKLGPSPFPGADLPLRPSCRAGWCLHPPGNSLGPRPSSLTTSQPSRLPICSHDLSHLTLEFSLLLFY